MLGLQSLRRLTFQLCTRLLHGWDLSPASHCPMLQICWMQLSCIRNIAWQHAQCLCLHSEDQAPADGVPPVLQPRNLPSSIEQLPDIGASSSGYRFVLFHWGFITVTRRSLRLALSLASLTFTALQVQLSCTAACQVLVEAARVADKPQDVELLQAASLLLTTTPAESLALGLRTALQPLRLLGVPVQVPTAW